MTFLCCNHALLNLIQNNYRIVKANYCVYIYKQNRLLETYLDHRVILAAVDSFKL